MTVTAFFFQRRAGHGGGCLTGQLCSPHAAGIDQLLAPSEHYILALCLQVCVCLSFLLSTRLNIHPPFTPQIPTYRTVLTSYQGPCMAFGFGDHVTVGEAGHGHSTGDMLGVEVILTTGHSRSSFCLGSYRAV